MFMCLDQLLLTSTASVFAKAWWLLKFNGMPCLRNGAYPGCAGCAQIINQKKKSK